PCAAFLPYHCSIYLFFFLNASPTTAVYPLSLHDALPIYDIVFHRPRFAADGTVHDSARVTVLHNGVLVQDNTIITGWTVHGRRRSEEHTSELQSRGHLVCRLLLEKKKS